MSKTAPTDVQMVLLADIVRRGEMKTIGDAPDQEALADLGLIRWKCGNDCIDDEISIWRPTPEGTALVERRKDDARLATLREALREMWERAASGSVMDIERVVDIIEQMIDIKLAGERKP